MRECSLFWGHVKEKEMNSVKYLDQLMLSKHMKNDNQLRKALGWASSKMSQYRTGARIMDNESAIQIALELGIEPMVVIMAADLDRAARAGQKTDAGSSVANMRSIEVEGK
jgi:hypothetical protein